MKPKGRSEPSEEEEGSELTGLCHRCFEPHFQEMAVSLSCIFPWLSHNGAWRQIMGRQGLRKPVGATPCRDVETVTDLLFAAKED